MKYLLDFDRTLFDADALLADLKDDQVDFTNLGPEVLDGHPASNYLYQGVLPFLRSKESADVYILTALSTRYGDRILEYQKAKIEQESLISLVHDVVYVSKDKGEPAQKIAKSFSETETIVFVDDLIENCIAVQTALPQAYCFLMVRTLPAPGSPLEVLGIPIVHTLQEVDDALDIT